MSVIVDSVDSDIFWYEQGDETVLQLSVGLDLYFARPMDNYGAQIQKVWNGFLAGGVEPVRPTWARLGGGATSRRFGPASLSTVSGWMNGSRSYGLHCFVNVHDGPWQEIGEHAFILHGNNRPRSGDDTAVNYVQMRFPVSSAADPDALACHLIDLASSLDYLCGTAGYMLQSSPFCQPRMWQYMAPLIRQHPGLEPDWAENGGHIAAKGVPGLNWLTFIGRRHVRTLGGRRRLAERAMDLPGVTVARAGSGTVIRAGERPRLVDSADGTTLDPYRDLFSLIEPVLCFDPIYRSSAWSSDDEYIAWLHRFARS